MRTLVLAALTVALVAPAGAEPPTEPPPHPLDGSVISVRIVGGFTPYQLISYEVLWRARVAVAGHYRGLAGYSEALHNMSLVPLNEYEALHERLAALGVFDLKDAPPPPVSLGGLTYEIEVARGERKVQVKVTEPRAQANPVYAQVIDLVRDFVVKTAGDLAFRNVFFEPGTFGYVNLTSVPPAKVYIDGRDIRQETPMYGYELAAGKHEVKLVAEEHGWERTHTLKVEPGMTTIIHFDLR